MALPNATTKRPSMARKTVALPNQPTLHSFLALLPPAPFSLANYMDTWGHEMDTIDTSKTLQLLLQNPNGIQPDRKDYEFLYCLSQCRSLGIGVQSLVETKLNWNKNTSFSARRAFQRTWEFSSLAPSQVDENFVSHQQPGGTLTAVIDRWTSRVHSKGQDPYGLGCWSYITLRGKQDTLITIVSAYRVSQKSSTSLGIKTAYMQQYRSLQSHFLKSKKLQTPEPNRQFIIDLQAWLQHLQSQGHQLILNLDNNDDLYISEGSIHPLPYNPDSPVSDKSHNGSPQTLALTCGLIDILAIQHSKQPFPPMYNRGKKRIDYILISATLQDSVE